QSIPPWFKPAQPSRIPSRPTPPQSGFPAPPKAASHSANRARTNARVHPLHFHDNASLRDSLCKNHGLVLSPQPSQQAQNRLRPLGSPAIVRQNHRGYEKSGLAGTSISPSDVRCLDLDQGNTRSST